MEGKERAMADDGRLERIEAKLDRLSDAVVSLARMEERMITLFKRMDSYDAEMKDLMRRVAELERLTYGRGAFFRWMDRAGVAIIGAGVALFFQKWGVK